MLFITNPDVVPAYGMIVVMGSLLIYHSVAMRLDRHRRQEPFLFLGYCSISSTVEVWFRGVWIALLGFSSLMIVKWSEENARRLKEGENLTSSHNAR